jgi:uncharacterized coiled-coil protein SlyX
MSRGKNLTKAQKRSRRARRAVPDQVAEGARRVAAKVKALSCDQTAADELAILCGSAHEHAGYDVDTVVAAEHLWRRAAPQHALTAALADLHVELERHRAALDALVERFDAMLDADANDHHHVHLEPAEDDLQRIRFAVLGDDDDSQSRAAH